MLAYNNRLERQRKQFLAKEEWLLQEFCLRTYRQAQLFLKSHQTFLGANKNSAKLKKLTI